MTYQKAQHFDCLPTVIKRRCYQFMLRCLVEALLQLLAPARFVLPERALREGALVLQSVLQLELPDQPGTPFQFELAVTDTKHEAFHEPWVYFSFEKLKGTLKLEVALSVKVTKTDDMTDVRTTMSQLRTALQQMERASVSQWETGSHCTSGYSRGGIG